MDHEGAIICLALVQFARTLKFSKLSIIRLTDRSIKVQLFVAMPKQPLYHDVSEFSLLLLLC